MLSLLGSLRGGGGTSFVTNSLRFRSNVSAYLSRTFVGPTSSTVFTWSAWVKRGSIGVTARLFGASTTTSFGFNSTDQLLLTLNGTAAITTTAVFRDASAWYHIVYTQNGAAQTIYVNNNSVGTGTTANTVFNTAIAHQLAAANTTSFFDGYLTNVNFIDGQALTPASFGAINSSTGVWAPSQYTGTYGANGFYLKFADASAATAAAIGKDSSPNGNNWTPNNISVAAGYTYDSMIDVPVNYDDGGNGRGNYAVLSPIDRAGSGGIAAANLNYGTSTGSLDPIRASIAVSSGKWYWEVFCISSFGTTLNDYLIGVVDTSITLSGSASIGQSAKGYAYSGVFGNKLNNGTGLVYGSAYTANDVIGVALDLDAGTITFYKNNVSQGVAYSGLVGTFAPACSDTSTTSGANFAFNFGQRPFSYTPPAGFRALNTQNLPTPSIVNGANFMAATTYTGNATARSLSNAVNSVSFQPDLVWIKSRTPGATNHALFDSTRGTTNYLSSNTTTAETTLAQSLTAFNANGFSLGTDTTLVNANANSYVAWQWKESITAGLDIVSYAGTGVDRTVAHNLGVTPAMIIVKRSQTGATSNWQVRHTAIPVANSIQLNLSNLPAVATTVWASTAPTSSVFTVGTSTEVNASGISYVAYCFAEIAGFSKFGSYTGNGITTGDNGPFVFCGFRPRWVMIKAFTSSAYSWRIFDTSRNIFNLSDLEVFPNTALVEANAAGKIDITSNGFKIRTQAGSGINDAEQYLFAAFAEVPSKYALAR